MTHQIRNRGPPPVECPLASLGRDVTGLNSQQAYHHPLSSSPLNPQVYQMSRKSPNPSIDDDDDDDADDMIYNSSASASGIENKNGVTVAATVTGSKVSKTTNGRILNRLIDENDEQNGIPEFYHLSQSSSSSMDQSYHDIRGNSASIDLKSPSSNSNSNNSNNGSNSNNSNNNNNNSNGKFNKLYNKMIGNTRGSFYTSPVANLLQFHNSRGTAAGNSYILNRTIHKGNNYDSSSDGGGSRKEEKIVESNFNNEMRPTSIENLSNGNHHEYFLEEKMDSLYIQSAIRAVPLGSESNHYNNNLNDFCNNYNLSKHGHVENSSVLQQHIIHHNRPSSPSETSGSDRYLIDHTRVESPIGFMISNNNNSTSNSKSRQTFGRSNNTTLVASTITSNNSISGSNIDSSNSSSSALEKKFHPTKVKTFSEEFSNIGRFSPSLDQGYATLVSPSPSNYPQQPHLHPATIISNGGPWIKKGPCRSGPGFDRLPDEIILKIFDWLSSAELCVTARVCRRFETLAWNPSLWKNISLKGENINGDKVLKMIFRRLCGQTRNGACPEVEKVFLSDGCRISDKGLQLLTRRCPELTHLQLQCCVNVSNQALTEALTKCTNLQHLDVTGCAHVTTISVNPELEPPRRLLVQYLDLTDCLAIDDTGLKIIVHNCPQLVFLYLRRCVQITDAGLKFVPSFCIALKELSVSDCTNITDFGLYELAKLGAALRYLSVAKCDRVSDAGLKVIARRCYKLRYLNARGCEAVSDDSITVLARSCPRLRALDIGKCDVSDAGLRALAESCPNLKKLSLRNCDMITDRGVQCIAYYCRGLQQLNIQDCQISVEGYRAVKKFCKRCIIEHTNPGFC